MVNSDYENHARLLVRVDTATLKDLFSTVEEMNERHHACSKTRRLSTRIEPLVAFVERYAKAADTLSQSVPMAALIWGSLRVLLEVCQCDLANTPAECVQRPLLRQADTLRNCLAF